MTIWEMAKFEMRARYGRPTGRRKGKRAFVCVRFVPSSLSWFGTNYDCHGHVTAFYSLIGSPLSHRLDTYISGK